MTDDVSVSSSFHMGIKSCCAWGEIIKSGNIPNIEIRLGSIEFP